MAAGSKTVLFMLEAGGSEGCSLWKQVAVCWLVAIRFAW